MGLSVAVVLGFNIGGGNIRDRLGSGQRVVSGVWRVHEWFSLSTHVNLSYKHMYVQKRCFAVVSWLFYCSLYPLLIALSSHCCQVINVFLVTCLAPHYSPHQNTLGLDNNRETHYGMMMMSSVSFHLPKTNYIWHDPLSTDVACQDKK